jgi:hypothetical protein
LPEGSKPFGRNLEDASTGSGILRFTFFSLQTSLSRLLIDFEVEHTSERVDFLMPKENRRKRFQKRQISDVPNERSHPKQTTVENSNETREEKKSSNDQ